jgi:transposase-like protein
MLAFLASYAKKSRENITPQFRHGLGIVYEIEGLDMSFERIKSYEEEKLLSVVGGRAYSACPKCSSLQLAVGLNCPDCKKSSLARSEIMIHYECEYSGPVEEFISQKDSEYVCPKCSKHVKRVGIEYGKPGIGFKCQDCGRVFQYPAVNITCQNGHSSRIDEIDLKYFPVYRVNDEIRSFAEVADYFIGIQQALASKKVKSDVLGRVKGASGATHIFPLVVESEKVHVVVDFILDEAGFDAKILQKILRAADLGRHIVLLFVPQGLIVSLAAIVNPNKIKLLAVSGPMSEPRTIAEEVIKIVG